MIFCLIFMVVACDNPLKIVNQFQEDLADDADNEASVNDAGNDATDGETPVNDADNSAPDNETPVNDAGNDVPDNETPANDADNSVPDGETPVNDDSGDTTPDDNETPIDDPADSAPAPADECTVDGDCGAGKICEYGTCGNGCTKDEDCINYAGTLCNKKLGRCANLYASNRACSEQNCPQGCCYAEKGLVGMKCSAVQNPATCGQCDQGRVYSPEEARCIDAACSSTTDNCPSLNAGSFNPPARCYRCAAGELICKASTSTSGCSSGRVINAQICIPSGGECSAATECCSGMPCINGFCY